MSNQQIHKRLPGEQVAAVLENCLAKEIKAEEAMDNLKLKRSQFFNLASRHKNGSSGFSIGHKGNAGNRKISEKAEQAILKELKSEKKLIGNKDISIKHCNCSAAKDLLEEKHKVFASLPAIANRAKNNGYYLEKHFKKIHDREALANLIGELLQRGSSVHLWPPYMDKKLYLITAIDDYSRMILYAELVEAENVWTHILALKSVFLSYGCTLKYYSDQRAILRFVKDRGKNRPFNAYAKLTDEAGAQWRKILAECKASAAYALPPQAKGKIERPYRWLQGRIARTASKEKIKTTEGLRKILKDLILKYNTKWIHSTAKEIPVIRFENAIKNNKALFKQFKLQELSH